ncbi:MAG: hypothetical protein ACRYFS_11160 [Janthinobacterium lividum]
MRSIRTAACSRPSSEMEMFDMRSDNRMQSDSQFFLTYCRACRREIPANETVCAHCDRLSAITDHNAPTIAHTEFNKQAAGVGRHLRIHPIDVIMLIAMAAYVFRIGEAAYNLISFLVVVLHRSIIGSLLGSSLTVALFLVTLGVYCLVAVDVFSDNNSFKNLAYSVCGFNAFCDVLSFIEHGASFMLSLYMMWLVVDVVIALGLWRKYRTRTLDWS